MSSAGLAVSVSVALVVLSVAFVVLSVALVVLSVAFVVASVSFSVGVPDIICASVPPTETRSVFL